MRRILYWIGLVDLVWTQDSNDEVRLRIVWHDHQGGRFAYAICGPTMTGNTPLRLMNNGECYPDPSRRHNGSYVKRWYPYTQKPGPKDMPLANLTWRKPR